MKKEAAVLLVLAVVCILLFNVFVRLEYLVYPKDYSIFLYGLADKMLDEKEIRYYSYPLHLDGWDHLAIAKETIKKQTLIDYNPYLGEQIKDRNWEKAYTILLAETLLLTGIRPLIMEAVFPTVMGFTRPVGKICPPAVTIGRSKSTVMRFVAVRRSYTKVRILTLAATIGHVRARPSS